MLQAAFGMAGSGRETSESAIRVFAKQHSLRYGGHSNLCDCPETELSVELRTVLGTLCLTRTWLGIGSQITVDQAWDQTRTIRRLMKSDPKLDLFAASIWASIDPARARPIFRSAARSDPTGA